MESVICALLLALVLLVYFSGRQNVVNRRGAVAGFLFWLGLAKEAIAYNFIPFLEGALGVTGLGAYFMLPYSLMTWALYALAVPSAILFALSLGDALPSRIGQLLCYLPAALISCAYLPWRYHIYQAESTAFWISFACYNLLGCALFALLMVRAVKREAEASARNQKRMVVGVILPPVLFWALSVFLTHPFHLTRLSKLWQINALVILASVISFLVYAFHGGMMGLRLTGESYRWNSDMGLIRRGTSYTRHMIKNQTAKMAWCVDNLKTHYDGAPPEELAILSRSIAALQAYTDKAAQYADAIVLDEAVHPLEDILNDAFSLCAYSSDGDLRLTGTRGLLLCCDRTHMTEVFLNLFTNALEAMGETAPIEVIALPGLRNGTFKLCVSDHGGGIAPEDLKHIFEPYHTSKSAPGNLGLGLAYCKNVVESHGGSLTARSKPGEGTTMLIRLPASRVRAREQAREVAHRG